MTTITQIKNDPALDDWQPLDIGGWLRRDVFGTVWHILFAIILVGTNLLVIQATFNAAPVELSFTLAPNGNIGTVGNIILALTNGAFLTSLVLLLWIVGAGVVIWGVVKHKLSGPVQWLKDSMYTGFFGALTTLFLLLLIVFATRGLLAWGLFGANFSTNPDTVTILRDATPGAVWGIVGANMKLFAVGRYPYDAVWRVWVSLAIVIVLSTLSLFAWSLGSPLKKYRQWLVYAWLASMPITLLVLYGMPGTDAGAMMTVRTNLWGGFLLTIVIAVLGIVLSFPIGLSLALGRRSEAKGVPMLWLIGGGIVFLLLYWMTGGYPTESATFNLPIIFRDPPLYPVTLTVWQYTALQAFAVLGVLWLVGYYLNGNLIKTFCIGYIELIRGVPLITVLFMANVMLPIFLPKEIEIDNLFRVVVGVILFSAAYLAENVRGGLQSIPKGQYEAAMAVGLSTSQSMRLIILPQALRAVIPALVGEFIGLFKDTSLVSIVGLFDLLKIAQTVIAQPDWLGLQRETYVFIAFIYWIFCFAMAAVSIRIEKNLGVGQY
ncbi:amino acid ABC transporter permease [Anaerolineales bacterium HSG6]|nr:amino acid ABC transporter permease [Anaerolineales bacterium HSG6]MDM8531153.1 amino acid ABC transporter permease [Anaerolineales bacterium HSG25]